MKNCANLGRILCLAALLLALGAPALAADQAALDSAKAFLAQADAGQYAATWDAAAPFFQANVPKQQWVAQMTQARGPLGPVKARRMLGAKPFDQLPGAPAGRYMVIEYATAFAAKNATERVTMMLLGGNRWGLVGYYVF